MFAPLNTNNYESNDNKFGLLWGEAQICLPLLIEKDCL